MRKSLILGSSMAALLTLGVPPAGSAGPGVGGPVGATVTEHGRAPASSGGTISIEAGKAVIVQKVVLAPGQGIDWHEPLSDTVLMVQRGSLTSYQGCSDKQVLQADHSYLHLAASGSGDERASLLKNEGSEAVEVLAVYTRADPSAPPGVPAVQFTAPPAGCPTADGGAPAVTDIARTVAYNSHSFEVEPHLNVLVQDYILEAGYSTGWHHHPDEQIALQLRGTLINYETCTRSETWNAGNAHTHHLNSQKHHGHPMMTRNESDAAAEVMVVFFNIPTEHPDGTAPVFPTTPPAECPTMVR